MAWEKWLVTIASVYLASEGCGTFLEIYTDKVHFLFFILDALLQEPCCKETVLLLLLACRCPTQHILSWGETKLHT
jgi:hypothetical protein